MWLRQMAQLSTTMSHAHKATAFHYDLDISIPPSSLELRVCLQSLLTFLTSNRFLPSLSPPFFFETGGASVMSTSAMVTSWSEDWKFVGGVSERHRWW